jgi:hypothetical protein
MAIRNRSVARPQQLNELGSRSGQRLCVCCTVRPKRMNIDQAIQILSKGETASNPVRVLITLYIGLEEAQGRMQGLDQAETKVSITSSTKVFDDMIHTDNLQNDGKKLVTDRPTSCGIIYNDDPDIYERSSGTSSEKD